MSRSDTILFDQTIGPGTINLTIERLLAFPGKVKKLTITFYPGQTKDLQVKPYMLKAPDLFVSVAKFAGNKSYFSGDDSNYAMAMNLSFGRQDKLCVDVTNVSAYPYDLYVLFEVEYEERVV